MKLTVTLVQPIDLPAGETIRMQTGFNQQQMAEAWIKLVRTSIAQDITDQMGPAHAIVFNNTGFAQQAGAHAELTGIGQREDRDPETIVHGIAKMIAAQLSFGGNIHVRIAWEDAQGAQVETTEQDFKAQDLKK